MTQTKREKWSDEKPLSNVIVVGARLTPKLLLAVLLVWHALSADVLSVCLFYLYLGATQFPGLFDRAWFMAVENVGFCEQKLFYYPDFTLEGLGVRATHKQYTN